MTCDRCEGRYLLGDWPLCPHVAFCERCAGHYLIGEWPFCPHGRPIAGLKYPGDEIDEVNTIVAHDPVHFRSRSEKRRYLKEHGLQEFVRHVGTPGSDKSPHTSRWW